MHLIVLTSEQRREVERRRKKTLDRRIFQRLTAVLTVAAGHTPADIAHLSGVDLTQLSQWLRVFRNEGLEALCALADGEQIPFDN
jgi:transcriptional regulator with XRE-family HTH domain